MPEANGHAPELEPIAPETAPLEEIDAMLAGVFEPMLFPIGNGRSLEIRPLLSGQADGLYGGGLSGSAMQRFLIARCVYVGGRPIGEAGAARLPVPLVNMIVPALMAANGMATEADDGARARAVELLEDPKE